MCPLFRWVIPSARADPRTHLPIGTTLVDIACDRWAARMSTESRPPESVRTRTAIIAIVVATSLTLMVALLGAGVLAVAATGGVQNAEEWERWAHVGDSFGVLNSVLSGMAFAALVVTLWIQYHELSLQRHELHLQRGAIERSADAGLRMLHFELLKLSIEDVALARVWPDPSAETDAERHRQLIYANMIFQHVSLSMVVADYTDDQMRTVLRYLFGNEIMREYWVSSTASRQRIQAPGTDPWRVSQLADEVYRESAGGTGSTAS
jgi:hypothetical protein